MTALETHTATCMNCGTSDITGRFCPTCGAPIADPAAQPELHAGPARWSTASAPDPPEAKSRPRWLAGALIGATVVGAGAVVAVVLLALGGNPSAPATEKGATGPVLRDVTLASQDVYQPRGGRGYVALLPAGWKVTKTKLSMPFADAIVVKSAQDDSTTLTAGVLAHNSGGLSTAARQLRSSLGTDAEVERSTATRFAGARRAWRIDYTAGGLAQVAYLFDACGQRYAVVGASKPGLADSVKARSGLVASSLQPVC